MRLRATGSGQRATGNGQRVLLAGVVAVSVACGPRKGPLDIPLANNGVTYAGAAVVDITPVITETFTDLNGNHDFDGCHDDPTGTQPGCDEPFDDADGDGWFDAVWIGGYGPMRPAVEVHDPVTARALVIAQDESYVAFVSLDLVGLGSPRIHAGRDLLAADGFDPDRLLACSTHNHQGPDTMGLWGDPYDLANPISGIDPAYQERVTEAIDEAVRIAAGAMEPVSLRIGRVAMRDRSPWFSGANWGGTGPDPIQRGLVHDGRDPVVVSDQLLVLQGTREDGSAVFTWTSWSGHPEVRGSSNNAISSDWVGAARDVLEDEYPGSIAIHVPESLGGMQSALNGDVPLVDENGEWVYESDGVTPVWAEHDSWDFVRSHGQHIADAAVAALDDGEDITASPIRVEAETIHVPIENLAYRILGPSGIFDLDLDDLVRDTDLCPEASDGQTGCIESRTFRVQVGPLGLVTVPGELLPELFWGLPDDTAWLAEVDTPAARGAGSIYFPQHDHDCDALSYTQCTTELSIGDCDCLHVHAWPYTLAPEPMTPMVDLLDTDYRAAMSMTDNYLSYVIPEPDFNREVSLLSDTDGDHYEDTVSPGHTFATRVLEGQARIAERW